MDLHRHGSIDPANLAGVNKGFNKPDEYAAVLERLALRNVYAITSFIFGMDNDTPGVADRTLNGFALGRRGSPSLACSRLYPPPRFTKAARRRAIDAPQALAGVHTVCHGPHAPEDDHRGKRTRK